MELNRKLKRQLVLQHWIFIALLVLLVGLLSALTRTYQTSWDVTFNGRNSLSEGSIALLNQLKQPIKLTVYTASDSDMGRAISTFLQPYQRVQPALQLGFVDPAEHPQRTREAGVQREGEMVVQLGQRREHLSEYNESAFTNLLMRLARDQDRLVLYLDGHGERKLDGQANHDLGLFGAQLASRGFKSAPLNLALAQDVPHNAALLVIAGPRVNLLPAEVAKLKQYLARGGNLLWLIDQEPLHGMQPLVEQLGLVLSPGTVVDPQAQEMNAAVHFAIGAAYARHRLFEHFGVITVFPFAREVSIIEDDAKGWRPTPLIQVAASGWLETGNEKTPRFDQARDKAGPITIAVALERAVENKAQRVVVIGSGHFLANQYLGNAGNLDLGLNLVNWLAGDEDLIVIRPRPTRDAQIELSQSAKIGIVLGFLVILPLGFLVSGGFTWWRRRKP